MFLTTRQGSTMIFIKKITMEMVILYIKVANPILKSQFLNQLSFISFSKQTPKRILTDKHHYRLAVE